jgi:hypothetical protein
MQAVERPEHTDVLLIQQLRLSIDLVNLDEQRHPIGVGEDLVEHFRGQCFATGQFRDQRRGLLPSQAI